MTPGAPWEHTLTPALTERGPAPFRRYLLLFLSLSAVAYVAAFFLVRSPAYENWRDNQWGPMLEFSYAPGPHSADVVIFGDSSAFIGIDPRSLGRELGLSALVLPNTVGSLPITHDLPLRHYLSTHRRPRLLVLYFSPWNLNYEHPGQVHLFEGEEMLFRHGSLPEIAHVALRYPAQFLFFPFRFYNAYGQGILRSLLPRHHDNRISVDETLGHLDDHDAFPQLADRCEVPDRLREDTGMASVAALARRYSQELPVLVYMAPIPGCTNLHTTLARPYREVNAADPTVLPAADFVGDPYYAHMEPFAVPVATHLLATAIRAHAPPPTPPPSSPHP